MPNRLTRAQLAALTELHHRGRIEPYRRGPGMPPGAVTMGTTSALLTADLARAAVGAGTYGVAPIVNAYADSSDLWHVEVPASVHPDDRAAVARAVIRGEVFARLWGGDSARDRYRDWRPRVRVVDTIPTMSATPGAAAFYVYREV